MHYPQLRSYDVSHVILTGYVDCYYRFKRITKRARYRFEHQDWHGIQADARERINLYRDAVGDTTEKVLDILGDFPTDEGFWAQVQEAYQQEIIHFNTRNIAETFYNSVFRHTHRGLGADAKLMFVTRTGSYREMPSLIQITYHFPLRGKDLKTVVTEIMRCFPFGMPFEDLDRDISLVANRWKAFIEEHGGITEQARVEMLRSVFYRNKSAYLVGRFTLDGKQFTPFIIPLIHPPDRGILIDALLLVADNVTSIFSYHRSYFLADINVPGEMVDFLQSFLPTKTLSELYNSIGFEKHGKTVFYREFLRHMKQTDDPFISAPGIRGMVMYVFTSASLKMVFKVIRDEFAPPKKVTETIVKEKYELVKQHDRVGRMADSYLFEQLKLPRSRFAEECLQELINTAPSKVTVSDEWVHIRHVYIEKKMTPLNIYLAEAEREDVRKAIRDYGRAIKQLAAANIFPGDLLLKNFGVTRVKRVVFYDYDEIELLTDCNFRHIPPPRNEQEEMSATPYYYVGPNDIFPEEFPRFLMPRGENLDYLTKRHGEIFNADFWIDLQERLRAGEIPDVFPYRTRLRFRQ
ncbi:MAG: bifunctional isocitrate dehydrogenase kinase/phosphatase [Bacteroidota bacterium]